MKLIDEFKYALWEDTDATGYELENKCEKISDKFAVEFTKWCFNNFDMTNTIDDLLKIYKEKHNL